MTYQQYLDYISIRTAIDKYNASYAPVIIHLDTPSGVVKIPAPYTNNAKALIHSEQLRKDYPDFTSITVAGDCLIQPLPSVNSILKIPSGTFTSRINYLVEHDSLNLYSPAILTEPQFNYLKSGDPNVLRSNN